MTVLTWETAADWDAAQSEDSVIHDANIPNTSDAEVVLGYKAASAVSAPLLGMVPCSDSSGPVAEISGGGLGDFTVNGGPTFGHPGVAGIDSMFFDYSDDEIVSSNTIEWERAFTSVTWVNLSTVHQGGASEDQQWIQTPGGVDLRNHQDGTFWIQYYNGDSVQYTLQGRKPNAGEWWFVAQVYDRPNLDAYLYDARWDESGVTLEDSSSFSSPASSDNSSVSIADSLRPLDGYTCWNQFYDGALSQSDLDTLFDILSGHLTTAAKTA